MTIANVTPYLLPRDEYEKKRLNLQHVVVVRSFGGHVPSQVTVAADAKILDVGCGTGIWSVDFASTLPPTVHFDTSDISDANFLTQGGLHSVPSNVHYATHSVLDLPTEWSNRFDVVHQRLMLGGITKAEWSKALKELYRVTKPGGNVVLVEIDPGASASTLAKSAVATREIWTFYQAVFNKGNMMWDSKIFLDALLKEVGFEIAGIEETIFPLEGASTTVFEEGAAQEKTSLADDALASMVRVFQSYRPQILDAKLVEPERLDELLKQMASEWKDIPKSANGQGWSYVRFCARKPLA
jgi:ubiquinone/menaquinone biosynthesis C-methylase UbiE